MLVSQAAQGITHVSHLRSLPEQAVLLDVFKAFPKASGPLLEYHEVLLRGTSPLSVAQRELIAAYVSGLNSCHYCHGIHTATAEAFGVPQGLLAQLLSDLDAAPIDAPMRELLRYARALTLTPSRVSPADAEAVFAAGWEERALFDAVSICGLFNLMNRLVEGVGLDADEAYFAFAAQRLSADAGYLGLRDAIDA
jgi:uncharacterized peroxidase-related enzyme